MVSTSDLLLGPRQDRDQAPGAERCIADGFGRAAAVIYRSANAVARQLSLPPEDREDLQQELWLSFFEAVAKSNSATPDIDGALQQVTGRALVLLRQLGHQSGHRERRQHQRRIRTSPQHLREVELSEDLTSSLARLPFRLRRFAWQLQEETPAELGRRLGVTRAAIHGKIGRLRRRLEAASLDEYLREP